MNSNKKRDTICCALSPLLFDPFTELLFRVIEKKMIEFHSVVEELEENENKKS